MGGAFFYHDNYNTIPSSTYTPDVVVEVVPSLALGHGEGHVPGHGTRPLGRGQTALPGLAERQPCGGTDTRGFIWCFFIISPLLYWTRMTTAPVPTLLR